MLAVALYAALRGGRPERWGAGLMLAFGLGTLPNLLAAGLLAARLRAWTHRPWVRRLAGGIVLAFGAWGVLAVLRQWA